MLYFTLEEDQGKCRWVNQEGRNYNCRIHDSKWSTQGYIFWPTPGFKEQTVDSSGLVIYAKRGLISASVVSHRAEVNIQSEQKWDKKLHGAL